MKIPRWIRYTSLLFACGTLMAAATQAGAASSSCVTCHLDEDMLTDNLKVVQAKASAKQSGAG